MLKQLNFSVKQGTIHWCYHCTTQSNHKALPILVMSERLRLDCICPSLCIESEAAPRS
jgi:hypothetical protein